MCCFRRAIPTEMNCTGQFNHDGKKMTVTEEVLGRKKKKLQQEKKREECPRPKLQMTIQKEKKHKLASHVRETRVIGA